MSRVNLGVMFRCINQPELLIPSVQAAEAAGLDEVWVVEDCFWAGGISSAAVALASTNHVRVGLGIMPAVARNAAFTAMEIAALARLYPGRFLPGLGHGVADWMRQVGAFPTSQLKALEETTLVVKRLLAGERVDFDGSEVHLRDVQLEFPPASPPPLSLGVRGPKSLALSGRVADGTIIADLVPHEFVRWSIEQIHHAVPDHTSHRITVYTHVVIDADRDAAAAKLAPLVAPVVIGSEASRHLAPLGMLDPIADLIAAGDVATLAANMPTDYVAQFGVIGSPEACRAAIQTLADMGADSVILIPVADDLATTAAIGREILPLLRA